MSLDGAVTYDDVNKDFIYRNHVEIAQHIGSRIFLLFNIRFRQKVKVKLGSPLCTYFLTINDLHNGAKIVNLPILVVEI